MSPAPGYVWCWSGDVPSPIVVGAIKGSIAPDCTPEKEDDGDDNDATGIPDGCATERQSLLGVGEATSPCEHARAPSPLLSLSPCRSCALPLL